MGTDQHSDNHPPAGEAWTVDQAAEDLVAQVEELLAEGRTTADVADALEHEGVGATTALSLVRDVAAQRQDDGTAVDGDGPCGVDLVQVRRLLRKPGRGLEIDEVRTAELAAALVRHGIQPTTAHATVHDLVSGQRAFADLHHDRLRRLGLQGMVVGTLFTLFFLWSGLVPRPGAQWNLLTAGATVLLTAYSALLWMRHRRP